ncbi:hypothetical protein [Nannocystis sp. SCPEA4]|uniref:hypothetical protein n=1 Tax=Nannocystis sp. SCPEA4 TaxID=2996787 RepID=UPI00227092B1|nr:hypothetical protein [Nannocystis sp. SCPEA4]MCY1055432.1 hypothetical protein [Nannocystis sp. SCPEA4]
MANETTTTSLNDLIHSEAIDQIILGANRPASIHQLVAWIRNATGDTSGIHKFPRWDKTDVPAGVKNEAAAFTFVEQTTNSASATAGMVGLGRELTYEAAQDSMRTLADLIVLNLEAGAERMTADLVGLFTSATNTSNLGNVAFSLTGWGTAKAAFKAQNPRGQRLAYIGSNASLRGLESDLRTTGAALLSNPLYIDGQLINNPGQGYRGTFEGFEIYETGLCPDNDADTISTAFCVVGDQGALGLAVWIPWMHKVRENPEYAGDELFSMSRYAVAITNQSNLREVISED